MRAAIQWRSLLKKKAEGKETASRLGACQNQVNHDLNRLVREFLSFIVWIGP